MGRFINADALVSTGQGVLGNNMFAYCRNNPVDQIDSQGYYSSRIVCMKQCEEAPYFEDIMSIAFKYANNKTEITMKYVFVDGMKYATFDGSFDVGLLAAWKGDNTWLDKFADCYANFLYARIEKQKIYYDEYPYYTMSQSHISSELLSHIVCWYYLPKPIPNAKIANLNVDECRIPVALLMLLYGFDGTECFDYER